MEASLGLCLHSRGYEKCACPILTVHGSDVDGTSLKRRTASFMAR